MKRGCEAKNARSNAGSFEKSGGFGNAPWVNANARIGTAIVRSKIELDDERRRRPPGSSSSGTDVLVRNSRIDVAAARGDDRVEAVAGEVGAPDVAELDRARRDRRRAGC